MNKGYNKFTEQKTTKFRRPPQVEDTPPTHSNTTFSYNPEKAKALWNRFEFVYTPKRGRRLNMAEIELNVLTGQCLNRKIDNIENVRSETSAWQNFRNNKNAKVNWQFTAKDARTKLKGLYPTLES